MRLIDADALVERLEKSHEYHARTIKDEVLLARDIRIIGEQPTIDAEPVRHGEWVWKNRHHGGFHKYTGVDEMGITHTIMVDERFENKEPYCPFCGKWNESVFQNYCPNCGAKMDGGGKK